MKIINADNQDPHNPIKAKEGLRSIYIALYFLGAVLSGAGGNYLFMQNIAPDTIAPDRFTGSEAHQLIERVSRIEDTVEFHIGTHPDKTQSFDRRIAVLESQYTTLIRNQQRIIDKLDEL